MPCCQRIESGQYDVVILNFANCDMVGHTGVMEAAVEAVEAVDECLGRVLSSVQKMGGVALVTADHGNAEQMAAPDGTPFTAHTTNVVPFMRLQPGGCAGCGKAAACAISPPPCWNFWACPSPRK